MSFLASFLFAFTANIDNFTVGAAYGIKKVKINLTGNFIIAIITAAGTLISMVIGTSIQKFLPAKFNNMIGSVMVIAIGMYFIIDYFKHKDVATDNAPDNESIDYGTVMKDPIKADRDYSGNIDKKESVLLGTALAINNFGMGVGASMSGMDIWKTSIFAFVLSLVMFNVGYIIGNKMLSNILGKYGTLISGILTVLLGIYEFIF
ncbi:sporulation membrane protein YtaF [Clostridium oryzae]|uniref:Manganese efflux pump MntP n=1 Tax=Clostridium oryzae TaxID=1450648 RepID=A0A1V4I7Y1_9CLOT|nr:sporulation membrane protein YtaF [Clostridium oryzae]OPJ55725.1 manganese efflux pump MntP [Clostridium oryzae]